ncbi:MAG: HAD family hydrolase [Enterococcus sp.]
MNQHLIFMDIDGTLVDRDLCISEQNKHTIERLIDAGHIVYVATGRKYQAAKEISQQLHQNVHVVASNGCVYEFGDELHVSGIEQKTVHTIFQVAKRHDAALFFFGLEKTFYTNHLPTYFSKEDCARVKSGQDSQLILADTLQKINTHISDIVNGIIISEENIELLEKIKADLQPIDTLELSSSHINNIELTPDGITKACAIEQLQQRFQISKEQTIAFGDGKNDLEMFAVSGISVAMDNAPSEVKAHARFTTRSNKESGISYFLENYFNNDKELYI